MRHSFKILLAASALATLSGAASAQGFNVQLGVGDRDRTGNVVREERIIRRDRDYDRFDDRRRRGVVEERVIRRGGPPRRTVCRTVVRERVTPSGVVIRRPTEVCRTVVGGGF